MTTRRSGRRRHGSEIIAPASSSTIADGFNHGARLTRIQHQFAGAIAGIGPAERTAPGADLRSGRLDQSALERWTSSPVRSDLQKDASVMFAGMSADWCCAR